MQITITTIGGDVALLEIQGTSTVGDFLALIPSSIASLSATPVDTLQLVHEGKPLTDKTATLTASGVKDNDMLMVVAVRPKQTEGQGGSRQEPQTIEQMADEFIDKYSTDVNFRVSIDDQSRVLSEALKAKDRTKVITFLRENETRRREERERQHAMLTADPFDPEAQKRIAEHIRRENVDAQYTHAMEHTPEVFASVSMLYIKAKINGNEMHVFVDSGAQSTIMSLACARRCHVDHLIDHRFAGIARGVGTQKILGRVHMAQMQIGETFLSTSFMVLEDQTMDILLGLDMLKRHQCNIDLRNHCLSIGSSGTSTPFLGEGDLPAHARPGFVDEDDEKLIREARGETAEQPTSSAVDPNVAQLTKHGYSPDVARDELAKVGGNVDLALINLLTKGMQK